MAREATRLGIVGWVRNRHDGSVEALAAGSPDAMRVLVAWARRGPPRAQVARLDLQPEALEEPLTAFEQRPTV